MSYGNRPIYLTNFDEICSCDHEEGGLVCLCTRRKYQCKDRCQRCTDGQHKLGKEPVLAP